MRSKQVPYPGYDREVALRKTYANFDADFLIRKIDPRSWLSIQRFVRSFTALCNDAILKTYFPGPTPSPWRFRNTIPEKFRAKDLLNKYEDSLPSWGAEALPRFQPFPRVLRRAVENAQRFVLAGLPPSAVVVCTQEELMRSWKSYLGSYLVTKLLEQRTIDGTEIPMIEGLDSLKQHRAGKQKNRSGEEEEEPEPEEEEEPAEEAEERY